MKKFFMLTAIAAVTFGLLGCEKDPQNEGTKPGGDPSKPSTEYTENLTFTLEVAEVEADQAKIKVEHNGTTKDTWYGFATTETDIEKAIEDILAEGNVTLKKTTKTTMTVRNLEPETEYTFVAVGITADGKTFSEPATVKFTTAKGDVEYAENAAWTISYIGDYEQEGQLYTHVAVLESTDENPYFLTAWPKEAFDQTGIKAVAEAEIGSWLEYLSGSQYTFADVLTVGSTMETFADVIDTQYGLDWYIIAIGADEEGNATGLYAISDLITIVEEEMTPEYEAWLGDWTFTGANNLTQTVTFSKGSANKTFKMTGYEGQADLEVIVLWDAENQYWQINNQKLGTYNFGADGDGDIYFIGKDVEGNLFLNEIPICVGGMLEDGTMACLPFEGELEMQDGSTFPYVVNDMLFVAYFASDNSLSYISGTFQTGYPTFPMTITPAARTSTHSVKKFKSGIDFSKMPMTLKSYPSNLTIR